MNNIIINIKNERGDAAGKILILKPITPPPANTPPAKQDILKIPKLNGNKKKRIHPDLWDKQNHPKQRFPSGETPPRRVC